MYKISKPSCKLLSRFSSKLNENLDDWIFSMDNYLYLTNLHPEDKSTAAVSWLKENVRALYSNKR